MRVSLDPPMPRFLVSRTVFRAKVPYTSESEASVRSVLEATKLAIHNLLEGIEAQNGKKKA